MPMPARQPRLKKSETLEIRLPYPTKCSPSLAPLPLVTRAAQPVVPCGASSMATSSRRVLFTARPSACSPAP